MPRSMWRGAISFGMVAIPVRLYLATESKSVSFRLLCPNDLTPIKNKRWCTVEDKEVGWNDVVRGYEVGKDEYVVIEDKDLDNLPLNTTHSIDIVEFCADQEIEAGATAAIVFALALVFVFLFLAAQYESWSMPFMVILSVPLALFGAVLALWLRGMQLDVYSEIGLVMLIGLAAKNAILIVEFAKQRREQGAATIDAAMEAGRLRLRPILMTAFAFILGSVPLMVAAGAGAGSRQSIGTTVVGGMLAATVFGLALVPVFYAVIERMREGGAAEAAQAHAAADD